ncbi:MAG TPA: hypothetical protein VFK59_07865 [Actinomycetota bacterium]|jgi:hypothetical protein|nr:hypothetical protein [Actinomycetota bacterium]
MAIALTVLLLVLLWVAAVAFGRDSRDGSDWFSRTSVRDPGGRLGD